MNGKKARAIRRQVFMAMTDVYRSGGADVPLSQYVVTNKGRTIECSGYRKLYRQAKRQFRRMRCE